jgi:hypothetical protein
MRRILAVLLCLSLLLPLFSASNPSYAADSYLITIAEDQVLDSVGDNEMAVYIDGIIYAPYTTMQKMTSVYANYNEAEQLVTVYRVGAIMYFELDTGLTYDLQQRSIRVSAKMRDGVPYLPVSIVTAWMGMYFSYISAESSGVGYPVIRLASDKPALADNVILSRNASRLRSVARARNKASGIEVPADPVVVPPRTTALLFTGLPEVLPADENGNLPTQPLSSLLSVLEGNTMPAAFFLKQEELLPGAETLRELVSRGFSVGILLSSAEDPVAEAQACSQLYAQLLHQRVRLVCSAGLELTEEQKTALADAGFVLWSPSLDPDTGDLSSGKLLSAAQKALRNAPEQSALRLYPTDLTAEILPVICSYLLAQNFTASPINEWTAPF